MKVYSLFSDYAYLIIYLCLLIVVHIIDELTGGPLFYAGGGIFEFIAKGELWRLFSAPFLHLNWTHLAVNVIFLGIVGRAVWKLYDDKRLVLTILASGALGQLSVYALWSFGLVHYEGLVGSSDALHGLAYLWIAHSYSSAKERRERLLPLGIFAVILASVIYTCFTGEMIISESMKSPGYSHLAGILGFMVARKSGFLKSKVHAGGPGVYVKTA